MKFGIQIILVFLVLVIMLGSIFDRKKVAPTSITDIPAQEIQPPAIAKVKLVRQLPDHYTPCTIEINNIHDLYTDGEPILMLPPGWPDSRAIPYSGKGELVIQGGSIHPGLWKFWSAANPTNRVRVRVFADP